MRRLLVRLVVLPGLLALTATVWGYDAGVAPTQADHSDGNMPGQVNYWLVQDGQLRVCDHSSLITTGQFNGGLAYWNSGIGATIAVSSCIDFGVELVDVPNGVVCGWRDAQHTIPVGACADYPELDPITGLARVRGMYIAPYLPNESIAPDDTFFPFVIAHELGHNLGFNHLF